MIPWSFLDVMNFAPLYIADFKLKGTVVAKFLSEYQDRRNQRSIDSCRQGPNKMAEKNKHSYTRLSFP